jgi:hypothetical protein
LQYAVETEPLMLFEKQFRGMHRERQNGRSKWQLEMMSDYLEKTALYGKFTVVSQLSSEEFVLF